MNTFFEKKLELWGKIVTARESDDEQAEETARQELDSMSRQMVRPVPIGAKAQYD